MRFFLLGRWNILYSCAKCQDLLIYVYVFSTWRSSLTMLTKEQQVLQPILWLHRRSYWMVNVASMGGAVLHVPTSSFSVCERFWVFVTCLSERFHRVCQKLQNSSSWKQWCSPGHILTLGWYLSSVYIGSSSSPALFLIRMCRSVSGPSVLRLRWSSLSVPFCSGHVFSVRVCFYFSLTCL